MNKTDFKSALIAAFVVIAFAVPSAEGAPDPVSSAVKETSGASGTQPNLHAPPFTPTPGESSSAAQSQPAPRFVTRGNAEASGGPTVAAPSQKQAAALHEYSGKDNEYPSKRSDYAGKNSKYPSKGGEYVHKGGQQPFFGGSRYAVSPDRPTVRRAEYPRGNMTYTGKTAFVPKAPTDVRR